mmetsp:Transcript_45484/g.134621  ORF Transcript_45484/g.134621 Transcript_45484/m.134621 type:complete len:380 (+) Transcript_45484:40-1179(+)
MPKNLERSMTISWGRVPPSARCRPPASLVLGGPRDALLRLGDEVRQHVRDELLLEGVHLAVGVDGLDALLAQGHREGEELGARDHVRLDEGALRDVALAGEARHHAVRELGAGEGHGERGGAAARLGLDDLVAAEHDAMGEGVALGVGERHGRGGLREEGHDGGAGVAADDGHPDLQRVVAPVRADEGVRAADVERGDAEELLGVVHALLLQHLRGDGHRGVDRVGDDQDGRLGAGLGDAEHEVPHDAGVDVEEVVARHARLAGHAGGDHDHVAAVQSLLQLVARVAHALRVGGDVGEVAGHARCDGRDVEAGERGDAGVDLQEQRQGLADASGGAEDGGLEAALLLLDRGRLGRGAGGGAQGGEHLSAFGGAGWRGRV